MQLVRKCCGVDGAEQGGAGWGGENPTLTSKIMKNTRALQEQDQLEIFLSYQASNYLDRNTEDSWAIVVTVGFLPMTLPSAMSDCKSAVTRCCSPSI